MAEGAGIVYPGEEEAQGRTHHSIQLPEKRVHPGGFGLCSQGQDKRTQPAAVPREDQAGHPEELA